MKITELKTTEPDGNTDPLNRQHYANGRKITRERYDELTRTAERRDTFHTVSVNGVRTFYSSAYHAS